MTTWTIALVADVAPGPPPAGKKPSVWQSDQFWITSGLLAAALLVGGVVVFFVDRWRRREMADDKRAKGEELTGFRGMYERGELTEEEYAKVRAKVASRVKAKPVAGQQPPAAGKPGPDPEDRPAPPLGAPPDDPS